MLGKLLKSVVGGRAKPPSPTRTEPFVAFAIPGGTLHRISPDDRLVSSQASLRLRVQIPAREIARRIATYAVPLEGLLRGDLDALGSPRAVVIGKIGSDRLISREPEARALLAWIEARSSRLRIVADLSDHYAGMADDLRAPFLAEYQRTLSAHCMLTVPCEALREQVAPGAARGVLVVEDPWESPRCNEPRAPRTDSPRLAWFGNLAKTTAPVLERALGSLAGRFAALPLHVELLAQEARGELARTLLDGIARLAPGWRLRFTPWSPEATWRAIDECDVVLLPQDTGGGWRSAKSHNRLVEAIRGGRLALASPIPSYRELAAGAWVGEDAGEGLAWALANPEEARIRIATGQAQIAPRFSPAAVGAQWCRALGVDA